MIRRLRVDWEAVARARGNAYKDDYRNGTTRTALGDLVRTYEEQGAGVARPDLWRSLANRIDELAETLPGVHPRLRKYVRKLAARLS